MQYSVSEKDTQQLKALAAFLKTSFKGSLFGQLKMDECVESLDRLIMAHNTPEQGEKG